METKKITKKQLEEIYYKNKNEDAAKYLGVSVPTFLRLVRSAGIKTKGSGRRARKYVVVNE